MQSRLLKHNHPKFHTKGHFSWQFLNTHTLKSVHVAAPFMRINFIPDNRDARSVCLVSGVIENSWGSRGR